MGLIPTTLPTVGDDRGTEETDILSALTALFGLVNGSLDNANLSASAAIAGSKLASGAVGATQLAGSAVTADKTDATTLAAKLGLSQTGTVRRGKSIIVTEESRTNVAFGLMTTPDRVQSIVLPTDGLLFIGFQAMVKSTVASAATAALFLGSNQVSIADGTVASPVSVQATFNSTANVYKPIASSGDNGLTVTNNATAYTGDDTTGQVLGLYGSGGPAVVFAAAGTYDVSVQYKATSGSVFAKNRKLWVWAVGF